MAAKTLHATARAPDNERRRLMSEACVLADLRHPNVIRLFRVCADPGNEAILMEYAERGSVWDVLKRHQDLPLWRRFSFLADAATALAMLHGSMPGPILHGDVKTANMLVSKDWVCKVADFGFSSGMSSAGAPAPRRAGMTLAYAPPEQLDAPASAAYEQTPAGEMYSFAITMFEVITGKRAFAGKSAREITLAVVVEGQKRLAIYAHAYPESGGLAARVPRFKFGPVDCSGTQDGGGTIAVGEPELVSSDAALPSELLVPAADVELLEQIGGGSYGAVHLARCRGVRMAAKTLHATARAPDNERRRLMSEACVLAGLRHPNVIRLFHVCADPGNEAILMEYAERGSVWDVLKRHQDLPLWRRFSFLADAATALAMLHGSTPEPILHGDVKTANLLVCNDWVCKVADFGFSSGMRSAGAPAPRRAGMTLAYAPPEQLDAPASAAYEQTPAGEMYSFAITMFEVITGKRAFAGKSAREITLAVVVEGQKRLAAKAEKVKRDAEAAAKLEAAEKAKRDAEAEKVKRDAEAAAKLEAAEKAKRDAEAEKVKRDAEAAAKRKAAEKVKRDDKAKTKAKHAAKAKAKPKRH
eukprot:g294.t1